LNQTKQKLCINCKHFITNNDSSKFGKCSLFPKPDNKFNFLINVVSNENENKYFYCLTARTTNSMCGEEGKLYKKKYVKKIPLK